MQAKSLLTVFGGLLTAGAALMGLAEEPYVQASGNCYLDTEYCPNKDTCVEVDFEITDTSTTQPRVFGVEDSSSLSCVFYVNGSKKWAYSIKDGGVSGVAMTDADTARHTVILDSYNNVFYLITGVSPTRTRRFPRRARSKASIRFICSARTPEPTTTVRRRRRFTARRFTKRASCSTISVHVSATAFPDFAIRCRAFSSMRMKTVH